MKRLIGASCTKINSSFFKKIKKKRKTHVSVSLNGCQPSVWDSQAQRGRAFLNNGGGGDLLEEAGKSAPGPAHIDPHLFTQGGNERNAVRGS